MGAAIFHELASSKPAASIRSSNDATVFGSLPINGQLRLADALGWFDEVRKTVNWSGVTPLQDSAAEGLVQTVPSVAQEKRQASSVRRIDREQGREGWMLGGGHEGEKQIEYGGNFIRIGIISVANFLHV
jgi:hypothetical protein